MISQVALLVCTLAVLPPAGFALCVDSDGHWVIETDLQPGGMCCLSGADEEACSIDACDACIDVALASASALRSPDASLDDGPPAPAAVLVLPEPAPTLSTGVPASNAPAGILPGAPLRSVSLRL
jgi:hypothetical protein